MMRHGSRTQALRGMGLTGLSGALVWFMALQVSLASDGERQKPVGFERDVRPILAANCAGCHGADRPKAGLDLRSVASMMRGGKSGPALEPLRPRRQPVARADRAGRDAARQGPETVGR